MGEMSTDLPGNLSNPAKYLRNPRSPGKPCITDRYEPWIRYGTAIAMGLDWVAEMAGVPCILIGVSYEMKIWYALSVIYCRFIWLWLLIVIVGETDFYFRKFSYLSFA